MCTYSFCYFQLLPSVNLICGNFAIVGQRFQLVNEWLPLDVFPTVLQLLTPCGFWACKNRPSPYPVQMSQKATKRGLALSIVYIRILYIVLFIRVRLCIVSFHWYVFCILVVLIKSSLLAKGLARKTPLRKPNHGKGIISIKPRPKSVWVSWLIVLIVFFLCLIAWYFCIAPVPPPT